YTVAIRLLKQTCFCGDSLRLLVPVMSEKAEQASMRVSQFVQFALDGGLSRLFPERIQNAYQERAKKLGLITAGGVAKKSVMATLLNDSGIGELATNLGRKTGPRDLLGRCLRGKRFSTNPVINAIVQTALFATPQEFLQAAIADDSQRPLLPP